MTKLDQFQSVFQAAAKPRYEHARVEIGTVLMVSDLDAYEAELFGERVRTFLGLDEEVEHREVAREDYQTVGELLEQVERYRPDLICSYRHLHSGAWRWPYSLGEHLDVLTQVTPTPVVVLPRPEREAAMARLEAGVKSVMAMTDHLTGDDRLVHWAVHFTPESGRLLLSHVEDAATFERYIATIGRIPTLDTETAREEILRQLLKEPHDYITSCREELEEVEVPIDIVEVVGLGHHLDEIKRIVGEHDVDLVVLNTKDEEQLAMHGLAYPLAVELRETPLLML